jgi:hypothetical protein
MYMGNTNSSEKKTKEDASVEDIEFYVTNFITSQNFQDLNQLADMEYCNNLVIMTADIISNQLNYLDVKYLAQRLKDGIEINEMTNGEIIYLRKKPIETYDIENKTLKRRMCIGIAKFYVKIAHLFGAILTTINPVYVYKDMYGSTVNVGLINKKDIPKEVTPKLQKFNICNKRLDALINMNDYNVDPNEKVTINPNFCNMNYDKKRGRDRTLFEEPGIPELEKLYYDEYDYDKGGFTSMSEKMRKVYLEDVSLFYKTFTGKNENPVDSSGNPKIKKFSDILLKDYHKSVGCNGEKVYKKNYNATLKNKLFSSYAQHIKSMIQTSESTQEILTNKLKELFTVSLNSKTGKKDITINPTITEDSLQKMVEETRSKIIELYVNCEKDFEKGLQIFEAIVEMQIKNTSQEQINRLNEEYQKSLIFVDTDMTAQQKENVVIPPREFEEKTPDIEQEEKQEENQEENQEEKQETPVIDQKQETPDIVQEEKQEELQK